MHMPCPARNVSSRSLTLPMQCHALSRRTHAPPPHPDHKEARTAESRRPRRRPPTNLATPARMASSVLLPVLLLLATLLHLGAAFVARVASRPAATWTPPRRSASIRAASRHGDRHRA